MAVCMNPTKSFDMHHICLASPHTLFVPTLLVRCTTVSLEIRVLLRLEFQVAHPILMTTLVTDQK